MEPGGGIARGQGTLGDLSAAFVARGRLGGVAIISAEAKEVTVVYISGNLRQEDMMKLSGTMGIPEIRMPADARKSERRDKTKKTKRARTKEGR